MFVSGVGNQSLHSIARVFDSAKKGDEEHIHVKLSTFFFEDAGQAFYSFSIFFDALN